MSLRPLSAKRTHDPALERIQREHELNEALSAARHLRARLEMLGGHDETIAVVRRIAEDLAAHLVVTDDTHNIATPFARIVEHDDGAVTDNSGFKEQDA